MTDVPHLHNGSMNNFNKQKVASVNGNYNVPNKASTTELVSKKYSANSVLKSVNAEMNKYSVDSKKPNIVYSAMNKVERKLEETGKNNVTAIDIDCNEETGKEVSNSGKTKLHRLPGGKVDEPFLISVLDVKNVQQLQKENMQTFRLEMPQHFPRVSTYHGIDLSSATGASPSGPVLVQPYYLPESSRSASLTTLNNEIPNTGKLPNLLPHSAQRLSSTSLTSSQFPRRFNTNKFLRPRSNSVASVRRKKSPIRNGVLSSGRRFSDFQTLTSTLGQHIQGSFLSLAGSYGKSWKQSDQMVSLSYKSLETFVTEDNLSGLRTFLTSRPVVIDDRDETGATILILCATLGKAEFCKVFLQNGADVNAEDNDSWTALTNASKEGHTDVVSTLLEYEPTIDHRDIGGWTAFLWACYKGHYELAKLLLTNRADPHVQGQHHMTPLIWAAGRGHLNIVNLLLEHYVKVNLGDKFGTTPLIWACRKGYLEIAESLLNNGASVDATGMYSWTPLLVATRGNFSELVSLILDHKPNVNALDKDGGTALTIACKEGFSEISNILLKAGAYVNIQDRNGDTNLIYAARGGHKSVVEALLKKHADIDLVSKDKKTALYWAVEKGHTQVVKLLLSANADMEHATKDGDTALLRAVRTRNAEMVQMLVDRKARVSVTDKKGDTALHIAMRGRSKKIVEILLRNPKNSQMLYRPNGAGETPYNIDLSNQKTILGQIFGARRLNTNEENENMLGYDLYSSSLADILSEPSLTMPITVGLYARWGSGKSFLIRKLKEEMNNFARQWVEPLFQFTSLVILLVFLKSLLLGFIVLLATGMWYIGLACGCSLFLCTLLFLLLMWYGAKSKYDWDWWYQCSVALASQIASFKLVAQVIFCSPPGNQWKEWKDGVQAKPLKFIFAEGAKPSGARAGPDSVIQIMGSLFYMLEHQYGIFPTRFFRAFRPKPFNSSSPWKYRTLCGVPYIAIFFTTLFCALALTYLTATYGLHQGYREPQTIPENVKSIQKRWVINNTRLMLIHEAKKSIEKRSARADHDDDYDDDDEYDDDDDYDDMKENDDDENENEHHRSGNGGNRNTNRGSRNANGENGNGVTASISAAVLQRSLINPLIFILSALVALVIVANLNTLARMVKALIFSQRKHLLNAITKFDNCAESCPAFKNEILLMVEMVKCLDGFTAQQSRLVIILDGLDSCEQEKVLSVLDAVHSLFTDSNGPFIILLAIDPHIITKAIEHNATKVFRESSISGHDYLRNIIHLPFYLQNAGLRRVKLAEKAAEHHKGRLQSSWNEQETEFVSLAMTSAMGGLHHMPVSKHMSSASQLGYNMPENRRLSTESGPGASVARRSHSSRSRRLKASDSVCSSVASNLNRVSAASDLNKVLLSDDYFNDINPRSMRRLMNVVYITGRLLKAFHIEFNWYHLALWINITEQWPYRSSWIILYYERREETFEDKTTLKELYEKVKDNIPASRDIEPLLDMDKDERKFEAFLSMHENILHVYNLIIFLPFTINLDPYIKKKIKEDQLVAYDEKFPSSQWQLNKNNSLTFKSKNSQNKEFSTNSLVPSTLNPLVWGFPQSQNNFSSNIALYNSQQIPSINASLSSLPSEAQGRYLSSLSIESVFSIFEKVDGVSKNMLPTYKEKFFENNINGKVLMHCNIEDLKQILKMTFGDWELFKMLILGLREQETMAQVDGMNSRPFKVLSQFHQSSDHYYQQHQASSSSEHSDLVADGYRKGSLRGVYPIKEEGKKTKMSPHSKQVNSNSDKTLPGDQSRSSEEILPFGAESSICPLQSPAYPALYPISSSTILVDKSSNQKFKHSPTSLAKTVSFDFCYDRESHKSGYESEDTCEETLSITDSKSSLTPSPDNSFGSSKVKRSRSLLRGFRFSSSSFSRKYLKNSPISPSIKEVPSSSSSLNINENNSIADDKNLGNRPLDVALDNKNFKENKNSNIVNKNTFVENRNTILENENDFRGNKSIIVAPVQVHTVDSELENYKNVDEENFNTNTLKKKHTERKEANTNNQINDISDISNTHNIKSRELHVNINKNDNLKANTFDNSYITVISKNKANDADLTAHNISDNLTSSIKKSNGLSIYIGSPSGNLNEYKESENIRSLERRPSEKFSEHHSPVYVKQNSENENKEALTDGNPSYVIKNLDGSYENRIVEDECLNYGTDKISDVRERHKRAGNDYSKISKKDFDILY